jgi:hypothetical protein
MNQGENRIIDSIFRHLQEFFKSPMYEEAVGRLFGRLLSRISQQGGGRRSEQSNKQSLRRRGSTTRSHPTQQ